MDTPAAAGWVVVTAVLAVVSAWYGMQLVHELGHVLGAWATGGAVEAVVLPRVGFSRTRLSDNPAPRVVVWAGPLVGVAFPLLLAMVLRRFAAGWWLVWFAGFCLVANGAYMGLGWVDHVGDAGDVLRLGGAVWPMVVFGVFAVTAGLVCWHTLGSKLGLAGMAKREAISAIGLALIVLVVCFAAAAL